MKTTAVNQHTPIENQAQKSTANPLQPLTQLKNNNPFQFLLHKSQPLVYNPMQLLSNMFNHPVQRTIYKIASEGPKIHKEDPEKYAERTGDALEEKSLHLHNAGSTIMSVATSPITIFMHGSQMKAWTTDKLCEFLKDRGYQPKPDTEIVFITCKGALQPDEFLIAKGQLLADMLAATVYLAKGNVTINDKGAAVVAKEDGGQYPIKSQEELASILPKEAEGWAIYKPRGITYNDITQEIQKAKNELYKFKSQLPVTVPEINEYLALCDNIKTTLKTDRRDIVTYYKQIESGWKKIKNEYESCLQLNEKLTATIEQLKRIKEKTTLHKDEADGYIHEFTQWQQSISTQKTANSNEKVKGFALLLQDKQAEWVTPLTEKVTREEAQIEADSLANAGEGWGLEDDALDELLLNDDTNATTPAPGTVQKKIETTEKATANGKTLAEMVTGLPEIELVEGNELDLIIRFASMSPYGRTQLYANDEQVPKAHITPEHANDHYCILIELNKEMYNSGQSASSMGSLIETLTHEWSLHGAEHAHNIHAIKTGQAGNLTLDHEQFFSEDITSMDKSIKHQLNKPENEHFAHLIYESYLNDVNSHIEIISRGWTKEAPQKGADLCFQINLIRKLIAPLISDNDVPEEALASLELIDWNIADIPLAYGGIEQIRNVNFTELKEALETFTNINWSLIKEAMQPISDLCKPAIPLINQCMSVIQANFKNPVETRRAQLKELGIDTDSLDKKTGPLTGLDTGVNFEASSKKTD